MKCLGKKNFEFMYYERKLCFLHNMFVCNNSIISCMMPMYMQSNEYIQLYERCDISAQQTIASIRCHLFQKFCSSLVGLAFVLHNLVIECDFLYFLLVCILLVSALLRNKLIYMYTVRQIAETFRQRRP